MDENKFILRTENKDFELTEFQSPRGLREGSKRPHEITIKLEKTMDRFQFSKHIGYLIELLNSMEQPTKEELSKLYDFENDKK